ncbi:MAG: hypothetical protein QNI91_09915 [Arenicellales bacterium]|nr:hypothetical protein [Arenicellales bacterium]
MMALLLLVFLTLAAFTLPGISLVISLKLERFRYLFILALSLSLFAICLAIAGNFNLTWHQFTLLYLGATLVLLIVAGYRLVRLGLPALFNDDFDRRDLFVSCALFLSYGVYIYIVGPYDEIPADIYRHLERIQLMRSDLLGPRSLFPYLHSGFNDRYWYYLYAMIWQLSGVNLTQSVNFFSWFNGAVFLVALYMFSKHLLQTRYSHAWLLAIATCLFFLLHQGVVSFSFLRYYALSATMLATPVYFLVVLAFIRLVETGLPLRYVVTAIISLATPLLYHYQELVFVLVMIWLLGLYYSVFWYRSWLYQYNAYVDLPERVFSYLQGIKNLHVGAMTFVLINVCYLAFHIYAYGNMTRTEVDHQKVISLSHLLPFFRNLYVLNPSYQFYQTITLWGIVVYIGFILMLHRFVFNPYVLMGMVSPLFTVFNPVFVDIFLRVRDVHVLYRLGYMIPLHMAAACLIWYLLKDWPSQSAIRRGLTGALVGLLVSTLFSFDGRFIHSQYSRIPTLAAVEENRSARHWKDLLDFLNTLEGRQLIYTDPVTGYLVTAFTHHQSLRYKFTKAYHRPLNFDSYDSLPLKQYRGGLLVINLRDGGESETGRLSRHWPADILAVSRHYSEKLLEHVGSHPSYFPLMWSSNDISVHQIHPGTE